MSVVPLTTEGDTPTVVQTQAQFYIEGNATLIVDLDPTQLRGGGDSNVSYDLRVGRQCRDHREIAVKQLGNDDVITLHAGSALIIETEESIHLPRSRYGTIAPKVSLLEIGLSTTFSKIDPGYNGHLLITLFNLGKTSVPLRRRDKFCALTLLHVDTGALLYEKGAKQITTTPVKRPRRTFREWVSVHQAVIIIVLMFATAAIAALELITRMVARQVSELSSSHSFSTMFFC